MANIVGKIVDLQKRLTDVDNAIIERRDIFERISEKMSDIRQKDYLTVRYFDGNSFYDTVMILDLSDSTARRVERKAISEFTKHYNTIFSGISHKIM